METDTGTHNLKNTNMKAKIFPGVEIRYNVKITDFWTDAIVRAPQILWSVAKIPLEINNRWRWTGGVNGAVYPGPPTG